MTGLYKRSPSTVSSDRLYVFLEKFYVQWINSINFALSILTVADRSKLKRFHVFYFSDCLLLLYLIENLSPCPASERYTVGINISPPPLERVLVVKKGGVTYGVTGDLSQILPKPAKNCNVFPILQ